MNTTDALRLAMAACLHWKTELASDAAKFKASDTTRSVAEVAQQQHDQLTAAILALEVIVKMTKENERGVDDRGEPVTRP